MFKKNIFVVMWLDDMGRFCCTPPPFGERLNLPKNIAYIAYIAYIQAHGAWQKPQARTM
jgi:hypothetical protein